MIRNKTNFDENIIFSPVTIDESIFEYPFSFISNNTKNGYSKYYVLSQFSRGLLDEEPIDPGNFPDNIEKYYWVHNGENDEEPWELLCKLNNGIYAYYSAWCDYTGFDCQGTMKLIVSRNLKRLFYEGLTDNERRRCLIDKKSLNKLVVEVNNKYHIPVTPEVNLINPINAFVRVWENDKELILNLDYLNSLEIEAIEYDVCNLIEKILKIEDISKTNYVPNLCSHTPSIFNIDNDFIQHFSDPEKKWTLKMKDWGGSLIRKWGSIEVSFILY
jgi:hypothetical protein